MLQIILLLIRNQVCPPPPRTEPVEEEERDIDVDPDEYVQTRREKKRKRKPRTGSVSGDKPAKKTRVEGRKNKTLRPAVPAADDDGERDEAYRPEVALDMLADRIALWHAIGSGSDTASGNKGNADGREFDVDSETDGEGGAWVRPSRRVVEEWDWAQRFAVNIVER